MADTYQQQPPTDDAPQQPSAPNSQPQPATEGDTATPSPTDDGQGGNGPEPTPEPLANDGGDKQEAEGKQEADKPSTIDMLKQSVSEDDPKPSPTLTLRKILGGDILAATLVRSQIWLLVLIMMFTVVYVAFRYQCQQDFIAIDRMEGELKDAKYKALSISSALTEKCRESHILEMLKANEDSMLMPSDQPPYIIEIPEQ